MSFIVKLLFFAIFSVSAQSTPIDKNYRQLAVNCTQCHADPSSNAPLIGNTEQWSDILQQDKEEILKNIYLGKNGMPPLGYCSSCTEEDFIALIQLMAGPDATKHFDLNGEQL